MKHRVRARTAPPFAAYAAFAFALIIAAAFLAPRAFGDQLPSGEPELLIWDDLMPDGEFELLEELYNNFYASLGAQLGWGDPMAEGGVMSIAEGSEADVMAQIGTFNVVDDLDGAYVRLPGYVVPLDFAADKQYQEFLLVPYFGACLHSPPPPPNQTVFVTAKPAAKVDNIWEPVWIEGIMATGRQDTELANTAYTIALSKIELYR